jgi:hypothetical protein
MTTCRGDANRRPIASLFGALAAVLGIAGCGSSGPSQQQLGAKVGRDFVRIQQSFVARPGTVPTVIEFVGNFNGWISGSAAGRDIPEDVKSAGFATDPAPTRPLSRDARKVAAAIALQYLQHASSTKYGPLSGGYLVALRRDALEFRCKAPGVPPSDLCKGAGWQAWQTSP